MQWLMTMELIESKYGERIRRDWDCGGSCRVTGRDRDNLKSFAGMVEDDNKLIVETETVEAPVSSLLIASTAAGNPANASGGGGSRMAYKEVSEVGVAVPGIKTVVGNTVGSRNDASSSLKKVDGAASGSNINLIDHNPMSPHVGQASLRNKKSSLLIDSSNDDRPKGDDEVKGRMVEADSRIGAGGGTGLRKHMDEIANANRDEAESHQGRPAGDGELGASRAFQSSKASSAVPTPLMLPVASHSIAGVTVPPTSMVSATSGTQANRAAESKPFNKIMERPSVTVASSRELLRDEELLRKKGGSNAREDQVAGGPIKPSATHAEDHDIDSLHKPTKADFFAARLASAVGENDISDSEETFIYESAANSTKNAIGTLAVDQQNDHSPQAQHGIASKMSVPVLSSNAKLLTRLKNTRHTSMSALPTGMGTKQPANIESFNSKTEAPPHGGSMAPPTTSTLNAEQDSVRSSNVHRAGKPADAHSIRSVTSETWSPDKRLSLTSVTKGANGPAKQGHSSRKPSISNSTLRHVSSSQAGTARGKFAANNASKPEPEGTPNACNKRNLRTTASKIFDANGAPLRRYSGVPDDINLEDFIEQSNGHLMPSVSNQKEERQKVNSESNHLTDKRFSRDMMDQDHRRTIQEVEGEDNGDEDDMHSMFYYNHRGDLEARPQISDYEEDPEAMEDDHHDDKYFNVTFNTGLGNSNSRQPRLFESGFSPADIHFQTSHLGNGPSNGQGQNTNINEQTPLRHRKQFSRAQLSYSPHNFYTRKSSWAKIKHCVYFTFVVISLLTTGFILGFLLATNKELQDFNIVLMDNVLSSSDELLFDITVSAFNPGFFAIGVQDVNLDIFAKSAYISKNIQGSSELNSPTRETILLGTVYTLETPLKFEGGFIRRNYDVSVSTVKLFDPGSKQDLPDGDEREMTTSTAVKRSKDDVQRWKLLIKHEYELIVRGSMQYRVPFFRNSKSVAVQNSVEVRPGKDDDEDGDDDET
ncbi:hypothetical protein HG536_0B03140 [Torulaspora globosa]|uniref:Vacuolar segregation protein 7 n=1 Tax=Torulaspora globosa TaxID=48254 RepID=A0A7G3ZD65_9SACH|nr:uncharacterized protein HG536_0B03140 [Torulaspora globosa]QLL31451.1 hypothetical protein HG536_0B03140 [Torulaspora globosa]